MEIEQRGRDREMDEGVLPTAGVNEVTLLHQQVVQSLLLYSYQCFLQVEMQGSDFCISSEKHWKIIILEHLACLIDVSCFC